MFWWSTCYTKIKNIYIPKTKENIYVCIYIYIYREREREREREGAFVCGKIEIMHGIREGMTFYSMRIRIRRVKNRGR